MSPCALKPCLFHMGWSKGDRAPGLGPRFSQASLRGLRTSSHTRADPWAQGQLRKPCSACPVERDVRPMFCLLCPWQRVPAFTQRLNVPERENQVRAEWTADRHTTQRVGSGGSTYAWHGLSGRLGAFAGAAQGPWHSCHKAAPVWRRAKPTTACLPLNDGRASSRRTGPGRLGFQATSWGRRC